MSGAISTGAGASFILNSMESSGQLDARALICVVVAMLTWSSAYATISYALSAFTPGEVALGRLALGLVCFLAWARFRNLPLPPLKEWPPLMALGVMGLALYHFCLNDAETEVASGTAAIILALSPAVTGVASTLWLGERLSSRTVAGLAVALAGVVLVTLTSGQSLSFQPKAALVLISVVATSLYFVGHKPFLVRYSAVAVTTVTFIGGTVAAVPMGLDLPHALMIAPPSRIAAVLWLGLAPTFVGYLTWNMAIQRASVSKVTSFIYFSTPIALTISWLWLGEQPGPVTLIGAAIVVAGVVLTNTRPRVKVQPVGEA
jgi:drug/metabolite transporter (DMT)-like permease